MGQNFIPDTVDQTLLFPPSLHDWLPEGHLARFLLDVVSALDLSAIYKFYQDKDGRGQAAYRSEEHTSELQSLRHLVCRLLLEKKKKNNKYNEMSGLAVATSVAGAERDTP